MSYSCPKCDKPLNDYELDDKKCLGCGIEFKVNKETDVAIYQERALITKLAQEVFGIKDTRINFTKTAINLLKGALSNVVCYRGKRYTTFYRIMDGELKYFLFRLDHAKRSIRIEFDTRLGYHRVKNYSDEMRVTNGKGRLKSYMNTCDFELLLEVCIAVCERKNNKYGKSVQPIDLMVKY